MRKPITAIETLRNAKKLKEEGLFIDLNAIDDNSKFLNYKNSTDTDKKEKNRCMKCDNGRLYIYCVRDSNWKEKEVCLNICSSGRRNKCASWRLHIEHNPIITKRSKREIQKEKEKKESVMVEKTFTVKRKVESKYTKKGKKNAKNKNYLR